MWVLPSRSRPHRLAEFFAAYWATGATTPGLVRLDADDPMLGAYAGIALPPGWATSIGARLPLSALYNEAYQASRIRPFWGFVADDVVPETHGWDRALIETAGRDGMAVPAGGETTGGCPHFVLGDDLVHSVGWLALPGLERLYIDAVWKTIAQLRGVYRERRDIRLEHHHFSNGKALMDATYRKPGRERDRAVFEAWLTGP